MKKSDRPPRTGRIATPETGHAGGPRCRWPGLARGCRKDELGARGQGHCHRAVLSDSSSSSSCRVAGPGAKSLCGASGGSWHRVTSGGTWRVGTSKRSRPAGGHSDGGHRRGAGSRTPHRGWHRVSATTGGVTTGPCSVPPHPCPCHQTPVPSLLCSPPTQWRWHLCPAPRGPAGEG